MVCLIYTRVSIQPWVGHKLVDQVIDNGSDVIYTPEPIVERRFKLGLHILSFPPAGYRPRIAYDDIAQSSAHPLNRVALRLLRRGELQRSHLPRTRVNRGMNKGRGYSPQPSR